MRNSIHSIVLVFVFGLVLAAARGPAPSEAGGQDSAPRMTKSTRAESSFFFNYAPPYTHTDVRFRYEHSWSDLPDTLIPGRPFNIRLSVDQLERMTPTETSPFGPMGWTAGVLVTAGKDHIVKLLQNGSPIRIEYNTYRMPDPSPQLCLTKEVTAGYVEVGRTPAPEYLMKHDWVNSKRAVFDDPVPDKILDKDTFEAPKENIDGELMLVVIYAMGANGWVYVDVNYLYYYEKNRSGGGTWKLRTQFVTTNSAADVKDQSGHTGPAKIELK